MINDQHTLYRLASRVPLGERDAITRACDAALQAATRAGIRDAAIRVYRAQAKVTCADGSNGQVAVMIVRNGHAATLMWRRLTQAHSRAAYDVERVLCVKGTCESTEHRSHV